MAIDYTAKAGTDAQGSNMGGIKQHIFIAPIRDFATIETVAAVATDEGEASSIAGDHIFSVGKCFKRVYCTLDKGGVNIEPQGERDGKSFKTSAKIFHPGASVDKFGFASLSQNDKFIVLVPLSDGTIVQIGSEDFYAEIESKFSTGETTAGARGFEFNISSVSPVAYIYEGAISETPAV